MKILLTVALLFGSTAASAMNCADFSGQYQLQTFHVDFIQSSCDQVTIAEEFGSETLLIDGVTRTETDHNGSTYTSKIDWNQSRTEIVIDKAIEVGGEVIFTSTETYSILPSGAVQLTSVDAFNSSNPQTLVYVYERRER